MSVSHTGLEAPREEGVFQSPSYPTHLAQTWPVKGGLYVFAEGKPWKITSRQTDVRKRAYSDSRSHSSLIKNLNWLRVCLCNTHSFTHGPAQNQVPRCHLEQKCVEAKPKGTSVLKGQPQNVNSSAIWGTI